MAKSNKPKNNKSVLESTQNQEESIETTEEETQEETQVDTEDTTEATEENTESASEESQEAPATQEQQEEQEQPVVDKYEASRNIDLDKSYVLVKSTLARQDISDDEKLEIISNGTNIAYKAVIEEFEEYNTAVVNGLTNDPVAFANKVHELFGRLKRILEDEDTYVSNAKLMILLLLFRKYYQTSFVPSIYSLYAEYFPGTGHDYLEYQYVMATLSTLAHNKDPELIKRRINFNKPDFKYGKKLEELFINLYN